MYYSQKTGPMHIIDPNQALDNVAAAVNTTIGNALQVHLDTPNLGTGNEAFISSYRSSVGSAGTLSANSNVAYGVCLQPLQSIPIDAPHYVQLSLSARRSASTGQSVSNRLINYFAFCGLIDGDESTAIADGFDANNLVSNYCLIPSNVHAYGIDCTTQLLIKDIVSGDVVTDQFLCLGFALTSDAGGPIGPLQYTISARYLLHSLPTCYQGN